MLIRKSVAALSSTEKSNLCAGLKQLKQHGRYDWYVRQHWEVTAIAQPNVRTLHIAGRRSCRGIVSS